MIWSENWKDTDSFTLSHKTPSILKESALWWNAKESVVSNKRPLPLINSTSENCPFKGYSLDSKHEGLVILPN